MTRAAAVRAHRYGAPVHLEKTMPSAYCDALEGLAHQICHELRTPLNAVIGFSDMMRQELFGPVGSSRYREYLDHISESAQRMLQAAEETICITSQLAAPRSHTAAKPFNLFAAAHQAALRASDEVGRDRSSVHLRIAQSIEVWGDEETIVAGLTYLFRSFLLGAPTNAKFLITAQRADCDRLALVVCAGDEADDARYSGYFAADAREGCMQADAALLSALAVSLFKMQGLEVVFADCETLGRTISIELELSAQQAFTL